MSALSALTAKIRRATEGQTDALTFGLLRIAIGLLVLTCYARWVLFWRWLPGGRGLWDVTPGEALFGISLGLLVTASSLTLAVGLYSRVSALVCGLSQILFIAVMTLVFERTVYAHHYTQLLFVSTLLLVLSEPGASLSWDRVRAMAVGREVPQRSPRFVLVLFKIFVSTIYLWSGIDKVRIGFLNGHDIQRILLWYYFDVDIPDAGWFVWGAIFLAVSTIAVEFFLAGALWFGRTRVWAFVLGAALHIGFYFALEVFTFSFTMLVLYLVFIPPEKTRVFAKRLLGPGPEHPASVRKD